MKLLLRAEEEEAERKGKEKIISDGEFSTDLQT